MIPKNRLVYHGLGWGGLVANAVLFVTGCHAGDLTFSNVTAQSIDHGGDSEYRFDAVWTDFNGDGCPDAFVFGHADPATSRLWLNRCDGSAKFTLTDNTEVHYYIAKPNLPRGTGWMTLLDFNGDGRQDFWLWDGNTQSAAYVNATPKGSFVPRFSSKQDACSEHCFFGDIIGNHRLDVVHVDRSIDTVHGGRQIQPAAGNPADALIVDVDDDGWSDIVQPANGGYWANHDGKLSWVNAGLSAGLTAMLAADLDNDGRVDLVTVEGESHGDSGHVMLYRNEGNGRFSNRTAESGLGEIPVNAYWTGYGNMIAADLDNDGLPELLFAGFARNPSVLVLHNEGGLHFRKSAVDLGPSGSGREAYKARAAVADYDGDGRLDIIKTQDATNVGIWRNVSETSNHWMQARVRGQGENSDGVGAVLSWRDPATDRLLTDYVVQIGQQHPQTVIHAGLGQHKRANLVVRFPSAGPAYRFTNLAADQAVIIYANGCLMEHWNPGHGWPLQPPADCTMQGEPLETPFGSKPSLKRKRSSASANPAHAETGPSQH